MHRPMVIVPTEGKKVREGSSESLGISAMETAECEATKASVLLASARRLWMAAHGQFVPLLLSLSPVAELFEIRAAIVPKG